MPLRSGKSIGGDHEYGFGQVVRATYMDAGGQSINLEIYEMQSPAAVYEQAAVHFDASSRFKGRVREANR